MRNIHKYVIALITVILLLGNTGIAQTAEKEINLKVFPNPSKGVFKVEVNMVVDGAVSAKIFDMTGKLVEDLSSELEVSKNKISADVSLSEPKPGMHFLRIESGKQSITKKIIIK